MPATQELRIGTIKSIYDSDTGVIVDDSSNTEYDYYSKGANVEFVLNEKISFLRITLPNGRVVVDKPIKRPANG